MATITRLADRDRELMRRRLLTDQGPNDEEKAGGSLPIQTLLRMIGDPQDPTNVSFPFLRRMRRDHIIAMGSHFIEMPIVQAPWYYESELARVAAFADNLIRPIYGPLVRIVLRFLWAGYSPGVKNMEIIQPTWRFRDIDGQVKPVWDNGDIGVLVYKEVIPLRPESAMPFYSGGNFAGIEYDERFGNGSFVINGQEQRRINKEHAVWAVHDKESEDGSPYGFPRIAHAAPIFHMYRWIWTLLGRAFENSADPGPVVRYPREDLPQLKDGKPVSNVRTALKLGTRKRSGSTIALPSDVYKDFQDKPTGKYLWDIEYPKGDTNFEAILSFLGFLESAKLRALWLQEQGLIGTDISGGTSNRNVAEEFGDQRDASQKALMAQIDTFIDDVFVKPAVQMAFPTFEGTVTKRTIGMGSGSSDLIRQIFQLAGQENWRSFGVDVRRLVEANGFPMLDPEEQKRMEDEAMRKASQESARPQTEPTQGRRALVTQTGFGETIYEQLGGSIELSDDGDFVSGLPKTDVFSDKTTIAAARELRTASDKILGKAYRDFAIYVSKQTIPLFGVVEEALEEGLADEEFLRGDQINQWAGRILRGWKFKQDVLDDYSSAVRRALGKVFDRTARLNFKKLRSSASISSTDRLASKWLDEQGGTLVKGIMETTRRQLAEVLSDGVREGKTARQIAADIRSHFEDIPASRASMIARTEVGRAYNFATVQAGLAAGIKKAQLIDGEDSDAGCKRRNGRIVDLEDALDEDLNHPNCIFHVRLLTKASSNLSVRYETLQAGRLGRYDEESETILLAHGLDQDVESDYLLAVGAGLV